MISYLRIISLLKMKISFFTVQTVSWIQWQLLIFASWLEKFAEEFSKKISLIDDNAFSEEILPIESVRNLKAYLTKLKSLDDI